MSEWQRILLDKAPEQFLRGLLHSDGCRTTNTFKTKLPSGRVAARAAHARARPVEAEHAARVRAVDRELLAFRRLDVGEEALVAAEEARLERRADRRAR